MQRQREQEQKQQQQQRRDRVQNNNNMFACDKQVIRGRGAAGLLRAGHDIYNGDGLHARQQHRVILVISQRARTPPPPEKASVTGRRITQ